MRKEDIIALLTELERNPKNLDRRHLKKIYALMISIGHYPKCPWCDEYIYNINDFTWDHIVPQSQGGKDTLDNLQPMHKHCNNECKENLLYQAEYNYDVPTELWSTILNVRVSMRKKKTPNDDKRKTKYNNNKCRAQKRSKSR